MNYSRTALSDSALIQQLQQSFARDRTSTALLLADIAEVDARKLYLPAGYSSMHAYCVEGFGLTRDSAYKRIQAARAAREYPELFECVADGRLNLSGLCLLAPHLTPENAADLVSAAAGESKSGIEALIVARFPRSEEMPIVETFTVVDPQLAPGQVAPTSFQASDMEVAPGQVAPPRSSVAPIAAQRFAFRVVLCQDAHDLLTQAQSLLSHQIPSGDLSMVFRRVLEIAVRQLEKQKFGATSRPHISATSPNPRYIPRHVKRTVWKRDRGQCTFVSSDGHRCSEKARLEFDHIEPVARGGQATMNGIRLRCRAHNQYAAECTFGTDFMKSKRAEAEAAKLARKAVDEVVPYLRALRISATDAKRAAEKCAAIPDASLEERVKLALSCFGPRSRVACVG
ncbi:MAG TPA: hypothetical protein VFQ05_08310 [Candidatus Eisenbacteria bacterium]|nr:hypothetical protein [Candidatus Eisenbacteria bacterium]